MKVSLRNRFLIPMVILVAIGMGASTAISYVKSKNALVAASKGEITQLSKSVVTIVDAWFADRKLEIRNWSSQKIFQSALRETFLGKAARGVAKKQLKAMKEHNKFYENIYLATLSGEVLVASADLAHG